VKPRLFFAIGVLVLLCLPARLVLADGGPHDGYTPTIDACAGCHRARTAGAPSLQNNTEPAACYSCHGTAATGADTNVQDGVYLQRDIEAEDPAEGVDNRGLKGGGFVNALMDTDWDGAAASAATTSSHIADGSAGTAWGNGAIGSGPGTPGFGLSCSSCHAPHNGAITYRMLLTIPLNSGAAVGVTVTDEVPKFYTVSDTCEKSGNQYFGEGYQIFACDTPGETWVGLDGPEGQLSDWCVQCHTRYHQAPITGGSTAGSIPSGDSIFAYRHRTRHTPVHCADACHNDPVKRPFTINTWGGPMMKHRVSCMTCHVAHGSSANMGGYAGIVAWPDGATTPSGDARSSLLRVDNLGMCQLCHGK
jgi:predicted CXXCH cytochrome family protein